MGLAVRIPYLNWVLRGIFWNVLPSAAAARVSFDTNSFRQRAKNFFDHNAIGNSNVLFPLSIAGARIYGWEFTARSPRIKRGGEVSVAYSYQHAEAEGAITGGVYYGSGFIDVGQVIRRSTWIRTPLSIFR